MVSLRKRSKSLGTVLLHKLWRSLVRASVHIPSRLLLVEYSWL
jgi:hypothetical protein